MKVHALSLLLLATPAFAGSGKEVAPAPAPAPAETCPWFIGATGGYLTELEEDYYTLHIGRDTSWQLLGFDTAWYLEVGYAESTDSSSFEFFDEQEDIDVVERTHGELQIIPVTFNLKFERQISGPLSFYWGVGAGVAFIDGEARTRQRDADTGDLLFSEKFSDDDTVFTGQAFAGLLYNVTENTEIYGGARYIYIDDASIGGADLDVDNDCYVEAGIRFNF